MQRFFILPMKKSSQGTCRDSGPPSPPPDRERPLGSGYFDSGGMLGIVEAMMLSFVLFVLGESPVSPRFLAFCHLWRDQAGCRFRGPAHTKLRKTEKL